MKNEMKCFLQFLRGKFSKKEVRKYSVEYKEYNDGVEIRSTENGIVKKNFNDTILITIAESMGLSCYLSADDNGGVYLRVF